MSRAARLALAGVCVVLLTVVLTNGFGSVVVQSELVAASASEPAVGKAGATSVQPLDMVDQVEQTKRLIELRGRTLARRIRSLSRAVKSEAKALKHRGIHVKLTQIQDLKSDVNDIKASFKRVSSIAKIPMPKADHESEHLPAVVREKQKKLLDKALVLADLAIKDDSAAASKKTAYAKDDAAYKQALIAAAHADSKMKHEEAEIAKRKEEAVLLKKEKALLKARERREALERLAVARRKAREAKLVAAQRKIDKAISAAVEDAAHDLERKTPKKPTTNVVMQWAAATKAARKGDTRAVVAFCSSQANSKDCKQALMRHAKSNKPCNPEMPGYFQCIGVHNTGGTL